MKIDPWEVARPASVTLSDEPVTASESSVPTDERDSPCARVIRHVRDAIADGRLRPGDQLPFRDQLARDFDVAPATAHRAFARLIEDGYVVTRGRWGTFVAPRPPNLFDVALVFNDGKFDTLRNRFMLALTTEASHYDNRAPFRLTPHYNVGWAAHDQQVDPENATLERQTVARTLSQRALAGVIWTYAEHTLIPTAPGMAHVSVGSSKPAKGCRGIFMAGVEERLVHEVARRGGRRIALLLHAADLRGMPVFQECVARAGLEMRPTWIFGVQPISREWAHHYVSSLFACPEADRPDSLIVADDNLVESALSGLVASGAADRTLLAMHANFPVSNDTRGLGVRVGYDSRELLAAATGLIADIRRAAWGEGEAPPDSITVSARVEDEIVDNTSVHPWEPQRPSDSFQVR